MILCLGILCELTNIISPSPRPTRARTSVLLNNCLPTRCHSDMPLEHELELYSPERRPTRRSPVYSASRCRSDSVRAMFNYQRHERTQNIRLQSGNTLLCFGGLHGLEAGMCMFHGFQVGVMFSILNRGSILQTLFPKPSVSALLLVDVFDSSDITTSYNAVTSKTWSLC